MKRLYTSTVAAVLALHLWSPQALAKSGQADAFLAAPADRTLPSGAVNTMVQRGLRIDSVEGRYGVPAFVFSERALQQGPAPAAQAPTRASADAAAREHLRDVADLYRLGVRDVDGAQLQHVHLPAGGRSGPVIARYGRRVGGVEVFRNEVKVVMDASHALVAISGYLAPRQASDELNAAPSAFRFSAPQAIARAFSNLTGGALDPRALRPAGGQGDYTEYTLDAAVYHGRAFGAAPRAKKVLFPMPDELVPAYYVELNVGTEQNPEAEYAAYVISARDGSLLLKHDLTNYESFNYRVWADPATLLPFDGPQGNEGTPHPTGLPNGHQEPLDNAPSEVVLQNFPFSRNDPWLPADATATTGNNVDAYADLGGTDGFQAATDLRAPLSNAATRTFDYVFDVSKSPAADTNQRLAAVVNLFYVNNFLHDWYYDAGFDEASGNAQMSNYGRGGLENDSIRAEAQDFSGRNNANMSTPADGSRPRMQMYVFDGRPDVTAVAASPSSLARSYVAGTAAFGPQVFNRTALDVAVPAADATQPVREGCNADGSSPYTGTPFAGKIALVQRGSCSFAFKALNAQQAGALGVVIYNNNNGLAFGMAVSGVAAVDSAITIPTVGISNADGDAWRTAINGGGNVSLRMVRSPDLDRDGTLDNDIIAHEWGHYISNRLVGNSAGLTNNQGRSMGEGWADFHAMLLQARAEDAAKASNVNWSGLFTVGGYTQSGGGNEGYYYGIRRVPYTTNMSKNALTLRHTANGNALPTTHPMAGGSVTSNSQFHNSGEVWATMLWECYTSLLNAYPFAEAQDRMKRYLVAGYKLTPLQPTYLEARDALLAAAAASDPADYQRFLNAFAKRGAGWGAQVADRGSQDHIGVVESYETGNTVAVVSMKLDDSGAGCDRDGVLDADESGFLVVTVKNVGPADLAGLTATVAESGSTTGVVTALPGGNTLSFGNVARGATATARLPVTLDESPALATLGLDVTLTGARIPGASGSVASFRGQVNYDDVGNASDTETVSSGQPSPWSWTPHWKSPHTGAAAEHFHSDNPNVPAETQLISPSFTGAAGQNFVLSFQHRYSFESNNGAAPFYDGGVLELSVDGGAWRDVLEFTRLAGSTASAGYTAYMDPGNPYLGDRPGYVGMSTGFPAWRAVTLNFGTQFAGQRVRVRFRHGADDNTGAYGWDVDNVKVTGVTDPTPFLGRVGEAYTGTGTAPVCNLRPVAEPGLSQTLAERNAQGALTVVTLQGAGSFDPDATGPLTYQWTQLSGPPVTLSSATVAEPTFSASVPATTAFVFGLVVRDGVDVSVPKYTTVTLTNVNRAPAAVAGVQGGGPTTVPERSGSVTLDASGSSDADGEPLTFVWTQTAGPTVALDSATSATPTFTPPEVAADTAFTFSLVANDGLVNSAPASVTITVQQVDRAPVANAGVDQTVKARSTVTLAGTAVDPDGEAVPGFAWTQSSGPAVTLTGADTASPTFSAPDVRADTVLRFSLVASNALPSLPDSVEVLVQRFNRKPVAQVSGPATVAAGGRVTLQSTGSSDEDGDALTYAWTQLGGPTVALGGADTATATFTAPSNLNVAARLSFRLVVTDAAGEASAPAEVSVDVTPQVQPPPPPKGGCSTTNSGPTGAVMTVLVLLGLAGLGRRRAV